MNLMGRSGQELCGFAGVTEVSANRAATAILRSMMAVPSWISLRQACGATPASVQPRFPGYFSNHPILALPAVRTATRLAVCGRGSGEATPASGACFCHCCICEGRASAHTRNRCENSSQVFVYKFYGVFHYLKHHFVFRNRHDAQEALGQNPRADWETECPARVGALWRGAERHRHARSCIAHPRSSCRTGVADCADGDCADLLGVEIDGVPPSQRAGASRLRAARCEHRSLCDRRSS